MTSESSEDVGPTPEADADAPTLAQRLRALWCAFVSGLG